MENTTTAINADFDFWEDATDIKVRPKELV